MYKRIITKEDELKKFLKQKTNYSYGKLRKMLKFKSDIELMDFLIDFLNKKVHNFNFEREAAKNKYLIKLLKYYDYSLSKIEINNLEDCLEENSLFQIINKLNDVKRNINQEIASSNTSYITNECLKNRIILNKISSSISSTVQRMKNRINLIYAVEPIMYENIEVLLKEVVCNYQNCEYLNYILNEFPEVIYLKEGKRFIFEDILDKYFNVLLNKNNNNERLYYKKVIDLFLKEEANQSKDEDIEPLKLIYLNKGSRLLRNLENSDFEESKKSLIIETIKEEVSFLEQANSSKIEIAESIENVNNNSIISEYLNDQDKVKREDLTNRYVITMDSPNTKIFENAISIEKLDNDTFRLSIYTVDLQYFIDSKNDYYRKSSAKSIANVEDNVLKNKMFKRKLSLDKDKIMPVCAYDFIIDKDMNLLSDKLNINFKKANIKVRENIFFNEINDYRVQGSKELQDTINNLITIAYDEEKSKEYYMNGYIADNMICMINCFATDVLANYTKENNLPIIYFRSDASISEEIEDLEDNNNNLSLLVERLNTILLRKDKDVLYTIGNDRVDNGDNLHMRLFSPLRRIDATINQMLISKYFIEEKMPDEKQSCALERDLDKISCSINMNKELGINYSNTDKKVYRKK